MKRQWKPQVAAAFSLANLWFFRSWLVLLDSYSPAGRYFLSEHPTSLELNTLLGVSWLTAVLALTRLLGRRLARGPLLVIGRVVWIGLAFGTMVSIIAVTNMLPPPAPQISVAVLLAGFVAAIVFWRRAYRAADVLLLIFFPFAAASCTLSLWRIVNTWQTKAPLARAAGKPAAKKVIWILFDELDGRLVLEPDAAVRLPNLERLAAESLNARRTQMAAADTLEAVPALFTGQKVTKARPSGDRDLELTFADGSVRRWSSTPNLFREARARGLGTAAAGYYHPYCRVLPDAFNECYWEPAVLPLAAWKSYMEQLKGSPVLYQVFRETRFHPWLLPLLGEYWKRDSIVPEEEELINRQRAVLDHLLQQGKSLAADPSIGILYLHLPLPHPPGVWKAREQRPAHAYEGTYLENLEVADRILGEYRAHLEGQGVWQQAAILVTSDHALRAEMWKGLKGFMPRTPLLNRPPRVPFLLKLPEGGPGRTYEQPISAVVAPGLLQAYLAGQVRTYDDAARWLDSSNVWKPAFEQLSQLGRRNANADVELPE
ncbi:MAG: sulfatase-like hydrolase/transferase [Bryobacteraceae bacterium]|nr:sulfatase-like hydrolase/transferase [Bryobacteraceae bacterium]